jgi:hypothetical protein
LVHDTLQRLAIDAAAILLQRYVLVDAGEEAHRHSEDGEICPRAAVVGENLANMRKPRVCGTAHAGRDFRVLEEYFVLEVGENYVLFEAMQRKSEWERESLALRISGNNSVGKWRVC